VLCNTIYTTYNNAQYFTTRQYGPQELGLSWRK